MFGSLFDEDDSVVVMTTVHNFNVTVPRPPNIRPPCGLSGILNQGATCYLNALLQTLLFTPEFREGLFKLTEAQLGRLADRERGEKVRVIPLQLQILFARLLLLNQEAASTTDLTDSFGWKNNEALQEHDIQELNRILFSAIEKSLTGTTGNDLISKLYHGSVYTEIVCQVCGKISERTEDFLDLYVTVANFNSLQESLNDSYIHEEIMRGTNQYRCSTCYKLVDAKKGSKIRCLPPILTVSLSRVTYDIAKKERVKETGKFMFPLQLNMLPYCNKEVNPEDSVYELFSVVVHGGTGYAGHYHAYIRDIDCLGNWFPPDEEPLFIPSSGTNAPNVVQGPVSLIKVLLSQQTDHCLTVDKLCQEILKSTGLSWGKRFKNSFGPINKFLQEHDDVFFFNAATNMVYLKETAIKDNLIDEPMSIDNSPCNSNESAPGSPKETTRKIHSKNPLKINFFDKKKNTVPDSPLQCHWFNFNDVRVTPIFTKDIEQKFSGKESPYMLFYRRKSLMRPEEAKGNPKYMMPQWLLDQIDLENKELQEQRDLHEITTNTINVLLHFAEHYIFKHGGLQTDDPRSVPIDISIDRRKPLSELRSFIHQLRHDHFPPSNHPLNLTLYTAKKLPVGYHLYTELEISQDGESLTSLGILEGTHIFASSSGLEISGNVISLGAESEPILIHISTILPNGEVLKLSTGVPKFTTFLTLKSIVTTHLHLCQSQEDLVITKLEQKGNETKTILIGESKVSFKLSDFSVKDNDHIIIECLSSPDSSDKTVTLKIEDRSTIYQEDNAPKYPYTDIQTALSTVICDLKALAIAKFGLDDVKHYRLCKMSEDQKKGPPLHENFTIEAAYLYDAKYLVLEEGMAPTEDEITITFSMGYNHGIGSGCHLELNVSRKYTIQQCIKEMLKCFGLKGDNWKLQKSNLFGEFETVFTDTITLEEEGIQHGDFLLLTASYVPPKGFMNFKMWLYPTRENLCCLNLPNVGDIILQYANFYRNLSTVAKTKCGLIELGDIEISGDSTVGDLKKSVLTLSPLSNVKLPSIHFLRIRLLDGSRPTKVLRGLSSTLKKLRLHNQQSLCVQLLAHEENLSQETILLNVSLRNTNDRTYSPPTELSWDTKEFGTLKVLKQELSESYNIPIERLIVAKHCYDKFQWQIIEDNSSMKKIGKKWSSKKSNLRYSPYFLKDGDTIGIKDQLNDPHNLDDFLTVEDIEGQEILKRREQQKLEAMNSANIVKRRQRRQTRSMGFYEEWTFDSGDSDVERKCIKKPETGIIIHVDDFR